MAVGGAFYRGGVGPGDGFGWAGGAGGKENVASVVGLMAGSWEAIVGAEKGGPSKIAFA